MGFLHTHAIVVVLTFPSVLCRRLSCWCGTCESSTPATSTALPRLPRRTQCLTGVASSPSGRPPLRKLSPRQTVSPGGLWYGIVEYILVPEGEIFSLKSERSGASKFS